MRVSVPFEWPLILIALFVIGVGVFVELRPATAAPPLAHQIPVLCRDITVPGVVNGFVCVYEWLPEEALEERSWKGFIERALEL